MAVDNEDAESSLQDMEAAGNDGLLTSGPVTQAEIDDVIADPTLSAAERQARLEDLREKMLDGEGDDYAGAFTPLETRIMDALSMLADGGHDYGSAETDQIEPEEYEDVVDGKAPTSLLDR